MRRSPPRRPWAIPLVPLYAAASALNATLVRPASLRGFVLSVGSLSAGGAGKTPVVRMLAAHLRQLDIAHDVLSRGYKRTGRSCEKVLLTGSDDAKRFGDEPVELAQAGIPVFVGRSRLAAGQLAESEATTPLVHLLDDGFQHRQLARDLDLVLFTQADAEDWLLPAGNLREPLAALRHADVVLLREEEAGALTPLVRRHTQAQLWPIRRRLVLPEAAPHRPFAFCGIARPDNFRAMVAEQRSLSGFLAFPDHHTYTAHDLTRILRAARDAEADGFVTTEKDAVKLSPPMRSQLAAFGPLAIASLQVSLAVVESLQPLEPLEPAEPLAWLLDQIRRHQAGQEPGRSMRR